MSTFQLGGRHDNSMEWLVPGMHAAKVEPSTGVIWEQEESKHEGRKEEEWLNVDGCVILLSLVGGVLGEPQQAKDNA